MDIKKMQFVELDKKMQFLASTYFTSLFKSERIPTLHDSDQEEVVAPLKVFINRMQSTFLTLNKEEQKIINNDYFFEDYPYWWESIYSKKDYFQIKRQALIHFLRTFYEE